MNTTETLVPLAGAAWFVLCLATTLFIYGRDEGPLAAFMVSVFWGAAVYGLLLWGVSLT